VSVHDETPRRATRSGYDRRFVDAINGVLEDRDSGVRINDLNDQLWERHIGPLVTAVERGDVDGGIVERLPDEDWGGRSEAFGEAVAHVWRAMDVLYASAACLAHQPVDGRLHPVEADLDQVVDQARHSWVPREPAADPLPLKDYTVLAVYADQPQRYAETVQAPDPRAAEHLVRDRAPAPLLVAAVIEGTPTLADVQYWSPLDGRGEEAGD
jgi:hypothetical protein